MADPIEPDPPHPLPPAHGGVLPGQSSNRAVLMAVSLLLIGGALAYAALFRRWGYHPISPSDLRTLAPEDRAFLTVSWWDSTNGFCGPFPAIWPALALLTAVPLLIAALRRHRAERLWGTLSVLCALFGAGTVLVATWGFLERGWMSDSGWGYTPDLGTLGLSLSGYALLALGALLLTRTTPTLVW